MSRRFKELSTALELEFPAEFYSKTAATLRTGEGQTFSVREPGTVHETRGDVACRLTVSHGLSAGEVVTANATISAGADCPREDPHASPEGISHRFRRPSSPPFHDPLGRRPRRRPLHPTRRGPPRSLPAGRRSPDLHADFNPDSLRRHAFGPTLTPTLTPTITAPRRARPATVDNPPPPSPRRPLPSCRRRHVKPPRRSAVNSDLSVGMLSLLSRRRWSDSRPET